MTMRGDLRLSTEFRPITVETNLISCKDGSSCVIYGKTKVISSILGPKQSKKLKFERFNHLSIDVDVDLAYKNSIDNSTSSTLSTAASTANITQGSSNNNNSLMKKKYSKFIKDSIFPCIDIYKFPLMLLSIHVLIINDDGSSLPIAVNASILALLDAGIPMLCYIQSISIVLLSSYKDNNDHNVDSNNDDDNEHQLIVDPCSEEERQCKAMFTFSIVCNDNYNNSNNKDKNNEIATRILLNESTGRFDHQVLIDAVKLAIDSIQTLSKLIREAIISNLKLSQSLSSS